MDILELEGAMVLVPAVLERLVVTLTRPELQGWAWLAAGLLLLQFLAQLFRLARARLVRELLVKHILEFRSCTGTLIPNLRIRMGTLSRRLCLDTLSLRCCTACLPHLPLPRAVWLRAPTPTLT